MHITAIDAVAALPPQAAVRRRNVASTVVSAAPVQASTVDESTSYSRRGQAQHKYLQRLRAVEARSVPATVLAGLIVQMGGTPASTARGEFLSVRV